jgi:hypothetical protein
MAFGERIVLDPDALATHPTVPLFVGWRSENASPLISMRYQRIGLHPKKWTPS